MNTAYLFIDYLLNARVNATITNFTKYGTPNEAAKQYVNDSLLQNETIYPPPDERENLEYIRYLGEDRRLYNQAWAEIRSP